VPDSDVRDIAVYFSAMDHANARVGTIEANTHKALATSYLGSGQETENDPDADLYASACISCHYNAGPVPLPARPELSLNSALTLPEPTNFIQAVLKGVSNTQGAPGPVMPEYESLLSDEEVTPRGLSAPHAHEISAVDRPGKQGRCHSACFSEITMTDMDSKGAKRS
jgi:cytochrome c553